MNASNGDPAAGGVDARTNQPRQHASEWARSSGVSDGSEVAMES